MKALILAGGCGKRIGEFNIPRHKCLLEVNGKRVMDFSLEAAARLGVQEIVMVIGYLAETIIRAYGGCYKGIPVVYAVQQEQQGLVHAMACGRQALNHSDFCLFLGDEVLIAADHRAMVQTFFREEAFAVCGMVPTENLDWVRKNYSIRFDPATRRISQLVEKPANPFNAFIGTGNCVFKNEVFAYIDAMPVDARTGNKELAALIQCAIDDGGKIFCHSFSAATYVNVNTPEDFILARQMIGKRPDES